MKATLTLGAIGAMLVASLPAYGFDQSVVIDKTHQQLRGYESGQLVFQTRISTGRPGRETPGGVYRVRSKSLMHYSSLYENSPMPYSVQINGNYFIHGFDLVPNYPASHGCIRVPITGNNPARQFYSWVSHGTPVVITGHWPGLPPKRPSVFSGWFSFAGR